MRATEFIDYKKNGEKNKELCTHYSPPKKDRSKSLVDKFFAERDKKINDPHN